MYLVTGLVWFTGFALLHCVTGPENLQHSQSDAKLRIFCFNFEFTWALQV